MKLEVTRGIECGERGYGDESGNKVIVIESVVCVLERTTDFAFNTKNRRGEKI